MVSASACSMASSIRTVLRRGRSSLPEQVVRSDDRRVPGYLDARVLERPHQEHGVLVVVREHGVQAQFRPALRELRRGLLVVAEREGQDVGPGRFRGLPGPGEAGSRERLQAGFPGHDHPDAAAAPGQQVADGAGADPPLVRPGGR
ncbi:hypothetical protein SMICM304S_05221 [Streptomyces microflavus]